MKQHTFLLSILFVLFLPSILPLFHPGFPITHDGQDHVARIANFYKNLQEGIAIPRWAGNLNWGFGHPILEFLYPLPSYIASLFHSIGFSFIDSTKIIFGMGIFFSGICMYIWLISFVDNFSAIFGSLLYVYAPYRFVEVYVRGDIGENLAFVFMPLTLFFMYQLYKKKRIMYAIFGGISLACLILSHNAISLMYLPFIVFYEAYLLSILKYATKSGHIYGNHNTKNEIYKKSYITVDMKYFIVLMLTGFGLSAFFWIPALLEGKYTLRNIVTHGEFIHRFISLPQLIYGPWSYGGSGVFTVQLGIIQWLVLLLSPVGFYLGFKKNRHIDLLVLSLIIYTVIAIYLMFPVSIFIWNKVILLQNFQFPWRFLAVPVFTLSVMGGLLIKSFSSKRRLVVGSILIIALFILSKDYWYAKGFLYKSDSFFTGVYTSTTDTGESSPIWSVRSMDYQPKTHLEFIKGQGRVIEFSHKTTEHIYKVTSLGNARLRENTLYFPGWNVLVDGKLMNIEFQEPQNRGIMTFFINSGTHLVKVVYRETKLRYIADIASIITFLFILFLSSTDIVEYAKKRNIEA